MVETVTTLLEKLSDHTYQVNNLNEVQRRNIMVHFDSKPIPSAAEISAELVAADGDKGKMTKFLRKYVNPASDFSIGTGRIVKEVAKAHKVHLCCGAHVGQWLNHNPDQCKTPAENRIDFVHLQISDDQIKAVAKI